MMTDARKKSDQSGQALIELIVFLPLMFALYSMISGFAGAINGSINQQKVTRAYFYYRTQNNPMVPKPDADGVFKGWNLFGMYFVGWKDYFVNDQPMMPCYQISKVSGGTDTCEEYRSDKTQFIRVGTVYGICGATYGKSPNGNSVFPFPDVNGGDFKTLTDVAGCTIQ